MTDNTSGQQQTGQGPTGPGEATGPGQSVVTNTETGEITITIDDVVTPIKPIKGAKGLRFASNKGGYSFIDDNKSIYLAPGVTVPAKDPGGVQVFNDDPKQFLVFEQFRVTMNLVGGGVANDSTVSTFKVNPGKSVKCGAASQAEGDVITQGAQHDELRNWRWHTVDPSPEDPGGRTPNEWNLKDEWKWVTDNWYWVVAIIIVVAILALYGYHLYKEV